MTEINFIRPKKCKLCSICPVANTEMTSAIRDLQRQEKGVKVEMVVASCDDNIRVELRSGFPFISIGCGRMMTLNAIGVINDKKVDLYEDIEVNVTDRCPGKNL